MPIYSYKCADGHQFDRFYTVKDHDSAVSCEECNLVAQQVITAPTMVKVQATIAYDSPIDGRPITTHAARQDDLKRHGCIEYDPEMKKDAARKTKERQEALDRSVDESVGQAIAKLPSGKRDQLRQEVVNRGADCQVVR